MKIGSSNVTKRRKKAKVKKELAIANNTSNEL